MKKSSLIRSFDDKKGIDNSMMVVTNRLVKKHLVDKYELSSPADVTEFSVLEENGIFERGVYQIRTFGLGDLVVKVLRKTKQRAWEYHEEMKNTHLSWQQDSVLGRYILKVRLKSTKPDYDESTGLLFVEFEKARETLAQKIRKKSQYTEEERVRDFQYLVKAVTYLHRRGDEMGRNFHGDLKPDNIFIVEYQNADGQTVDCLKIGDIEESLGTIPYRDFNLTPFPGWEDGVLSPTGKKDDLMALKMIFLEMAYDFCLIDFCTQLLAQSISGLKKFLDKDALERKEIIEKNGNKKKYFNKGFSVDEILKCKNIREIQEIISQPRSISKDTPETKPPGKEPTGKENMISKQVKYINTKAYRIYLAFLVLLNIAAVWKNTGLYLYLSIPGIYDFYQAVTVKPDFWMTIIPFVIPSICTWLLFSMKNKKGFDFKDILVYGGTFMALLFMFCTFDLMTYNFPSGIKENDYLKCLYRVNIGKTRMAKFLLPISTAGVKVDRLEEEFLFDYGQDYRLILRDNQKTIRIEQELITEDFLDANKKAFIEIFGKYFAEKRHIHRFLDSGMNFIISNTQFSDEEITALLIAQFIKDRFAVISRWSPPSGGNFEKILEAVKESHYEKKN